MTLDVNDQSKSRDDAVHSGVNNNSAAEAAPRDPALACLVFAARILGIPAEEEVLRQQLIVNNITLGIEAIRQGAKNLKLKSRLIRPDIDKICDIKLPSIAVCQNGSYVVILRCEGNKFLLLDPAVGKPEVATTERFAEIWVGTVVEISRPFSFKKLGQEFNLGWFGPVFWQYRRTFYQVILLAFLLQVFGLITPMFMQVIIDKVLPHRGMSTLNILILVIFFAYFFQSLMSYLRTYLFNHTTNKVDAILGARLYRQLCLLPLRYFEMRRVGDTVTRLRELENIRGFLTGTSLTVLMDTFFGIVFFAVMFFYSPLLTWVVIAALPLFIGIGAYFTPIMREQFKARFAAYMENYSFLVESLTGIQTVKSLALEPQFNKKWEETIARYVKISFQTSNLGNLFGSLSNIVSLLSNLSILWVGARLVIGGEMTVGQFIAFNMLSGQAISSVTNLANQWQSYQQARLSVAMIGDILNSPPEPTVRPGTAKHAALKGAIRLEQVNFRYRPESPLVIQDMSFEMLPGQRIGIVGRSGSGKSTISKLIQRLYIPEGGKVLLDGLDLSQVDPTWIRQQIGIVMQENFLFNGSVRENIAIAAPSARMDEVIAAARTAGAHDFIAELAEGYDTNVGERGASLSGGQKQRIAIARALMTNPRILIFDEATSALDYESERIIMKNLDKICVGRTVIIIAHRLSTVRPCESLLVIDRGRLIEQGSHTDLMARQGMYYHLYHQQSRSKSTEAAGS